MNGLNDGLKIVATDDPGPGGASHCYIIHADESKVQTAPGVTVHQTIQFQNGPIGEAGVNGISGEALLAIVEDRLKSFQSGPYACRENALALTHLQESMHWLHHRTRERVARGVEGTMAK